MNDTRVIKIDLHTKCSPNPFFGLWRLGGLPQPLRPYSHLLLML